MIIPGQEYFEKPYYFFLKESKEGYVLYFSSSETILEARRKENKVNVPKNKIGSLRKYISKLKGTNKKTGAIKKEIEELVDADGAFLNSKVPILDPNIYPEKTMDQTVAAARITNDPITRGYRTYYGESVQETDMSKAFGYEETKDMDGKDTYEFLKKKMGMKPDKAKERTEEFGKDPYGDKDKKSKYKKKKGFVSKGTLSEISRQKAFEMLEDIVLSKKTKEEGEEISDLLRKQIERLKARAKKEGLEIKDLISLLRK